MSLSSPLSLALLLFTVSASGCNAVHDLDVEVDCNNVCQRYRDCWDSSYDVVACRTRCDEFNNNDRRSANECDTCLDSRACAESFACGGVCQGILP